MNKKVSNNNIESICGLTPMQSGMLYHKMLNNESTEYVLQDSFLFDGVINDKYFIESIELLCYKFEVLRTVFMYKKVLTPRQIVLKERKEEINIINLIEMSDKQKKTEMEKIKDKDINRGFDLENDNLFRAMLIKLSEAESIILFTCHHIITDGWCNSLLFKDFIENYNDLESGMSYEQLREKVDTNRKLVSKYCDYVKWIESKDQSMGLEYFKNLLDGYDNSDMIKSACNVKDKSKFIKIAEKKLSKRLYEELLALAAKLNITINTVFETVWGILLHRYTKTDDIVFGKVVSGRNADIMGIENMVGLFINTVPVRIMSDKNVTVEDMLKKQQLQSMESGEYDYCSLLDIQKNTYLQSDLFHTLFVFENYYIDDDIKNSQSTGQLKWSYSREETNYPITASIFCSEEVDVSIMFDASLYDIVEMDSLLNKYEKLLSSVAKNYKKSVTDLDMLDEKEREIILNSFSQTDKENEDNDYTVMELIEKQRLNHPDHIALMMEGKQLTYKEFHRRVNTLAVKLRSLGVKPNDFIAIIAERSMEMIIGIYAIVKAGGAYVPVDPSYPQNRIQYILEDCNPKAVLTYGAEVNTQRVVIDLEDERLWENTFDTIDNINKGDDYLYCIYTSGTTGEPKGVINVHSGLNNLLHWMQDRYPLSESDVILQKTTFVFDVSASEIFWWSIIGASLAILKPEGEKDTEAIVSAIEKHRVTVIDFVPSMLSAFLASLEDYEKLISKISSLEYVIAAGEALNEELANKFYKILQSHNEKIKLINLYGPTEASIYTTYFDCEPNLEMVPIGKPISNVSIYIIYEGKLCPIGVPGELCIGGKGLAVGYLNKEGLTNEKFIDNPFGIGKLYRSGDLARWKFDGNIDYQGRLDEQVKIRGFRIELGEIENVIRRLDDVKDVAVIAKKDKTNDNAIYAYFVSDKILDFKIISDQLHEQLPPYMVPSYMTKIDYIPVTRNGKLDRRALPDIEAKSRKEYIPPRTKEEISLCNVLSKILGVEQVGISDNFFELGGDSIKAIRIVSKMREAGYETTVKDIIGKHSVEMIAKGVQVLKETYDQNEVTGVIAKTPIINEFDTWNFMKPEYFNQSIMINVTGQKVEDIKVAIGALVAHHDILRAVYSNKTMSINGIHESNMYDFIALNYCGQKDYKDQIEHECNKLQASMNLEKGPLVKVALFQCDDRDYLMICIHHLIIDGVSWRIILEDYVTASNQLIEGEKIRLQDKTASFMEWSSSLTEYRDSKQFLKEKEYWDKVLPSMRQIPLIKKVATCKTGIGSIDIVLEQEATKGILRSANNAFHTSSNDLFLSALSTAIYDTTGNKEAVIVLEGHGREEIHKKINIDRTVGWFTNMYPVLLQYYSDIEENIIQTKETLRRVPNHGLAYGLLTKQEKDIPVEIYFNYLGEMEDSQSKLQVYDISTGQDSAVENIFPGKIFINGAVEEGRLHFNFTYDRGCYNENLIESFAKGFRNAIMQEYEYCIHKKNTIKTASDYKTIDLSQNDLNYITSYYGMDNEIEDIYSLTPLQEGMLFINRMGEHTTGYIIQNIVEVSSGLENQLIEDTLRILERKYEVLRTSMVYRWIEKPRQVILKNRHVEYEQINFDLYEDKIAETKLRTISIEDVERGFNFEEDSLLRIKHIQMKEGKSKLIWTYHHIIMDGWCTSILFGDFIRYYEMMKMGYKYTEVLDIAQEESRESSKYGEYVNYLERCDLKEGLDYWKELLKDYDESIGIQPMVKRNNPKEQLAKENITLTDDMVKLLKMKSSEKAVTLNSIFETAWGVLLQKYNYTDDVLFGKVVSGRNVDLIGIEDMIGLFINTIPLRVTNNDNTVGELISNIQQQGLESSSYEYCSLADIQALTKQGTNLIKTLFVFENYYVNKKKMQDLSEKMQFNIESVREQTNYDLTLSVSFENDQDLECEIIYNSDQYKKGEIELILSRLKKILEEFLYGWDKKVSELDAVTKEEQQILLSDYNATNKKYDREQTVASILEEKCRKNPDKIAVKYEDINITYQQLKEKSDAIAEKLRKIGVNKDDFVAIISEKSVEMIIGICAIVKAGGAYVPIDTRYPKERINYIIEDCNPKAIMIYGVDVDIESNIPIIDLSQLSNYQKNEEELHLINRSSDLVYMIYTSGSTGKPKGVMIEQTSVINLVKNGDCIKLNKDTIILQTAALAFDASTYEIWGALLNGGMLHLVNQDILLDSNKLKNYIVWGKINTMFLTTALFNQFVKVDPSVFDSLAYLIFGGEKASDECVNIIRRRGHNYTLINAYGPTEITTFSNCYLIENDRDTTPIGVPYANTQIYIMNGMHLCGIGVQGELCVAGDGVARGYLNRDELTKEKFIDNPFGPGKLYRTGDLARWLDDGNIEYIDRIDQQVKVRGFRIELEEIASHIRNNAQVNDVVVVAKDENGEKVICAYLVSDQIIEINDIRNELLTIIPDYMIPAYMKQIDKIPLTTNGKLDRRALPTIEVNTISEFEAPQDEMEETICELFQEILSINKIGRNDNFFEMGGHSLRATRLLNRIELKTGIRIKLKQVFQYPTVKELAQLVKNDTQNDYTPIPIAEVKEYYEMSSVQKRMYLISQIEKDSMVYNLQLAFHLFGDIDAKKLEDALQMMIDEHEILRTDFLMIESRFVQKIRETVKVDFMYLSECDEMEHELLEKFEQPFNLEKAPLFRVRLMKQKVGYILYISMHHIISDGMSLGNFMEELTQIYNDKAKNREIRQYKDYSEWISEVSSEPQKEYWTSMFRDEIPVLDIPTDFVRPKKQSFEGNMIGGIIDHNLSEKIKIIARATETTEYMVFLSAAMILLSKYSLQEDIIIGSPISGRTHKDTENMLGMFVNTLALRGKPKKNITFREFLLQVKDTCLKAYENQEYPFEDLLENINVVRDLSRNPLFDVMLALQNNEQPKCSFGDVEVEYINQNTSVSKSDLTFNISEEAESFEIMLEYCSALFKEEAIYRMLLHYSQILNEITDNPDVILGQIKTVSKEEEKKILVDFNNTYRVYEKDKSVVDLLEEQCQMRPDKVAISFENETMTYGELKEKSDVLGKKLQDLGVGTDDFVAILSDRSIEMIVGICGIIKAGGAYVPIDIKYPKDRVNQILDDCKPKVILTYHPGNYANNFTDTKRNVTFIDLASADLWEYSSKDYVQVSMPNDIIYTIYTSGTTGKSKGTLIKHQNVVKLVKNADYLNFDEELVILQTGALAFDASTFEIWGALLNGGKITLISEEKLLDADKLKAVIKREGINTMFITTSLFNHMVQNAIGIFETVTNVLFGGEKASEECVRLFMERYPEGNLSNVYGPTEATTFTTSYRLKKESEKIYIGKPISNTQVYVMNEMQLCGIGQKGELCIAGDGVAKGYLNRVELTAEKFIKNPFGPGLLYRSGDLVRWSEEGNIEYIGRIDEQVKIRGFRIELSEIESQIRKCIDVTDVAVIVREDHLGKAIHAYLVSSKTIVMSQVRAELAKELPDYMIPSYMIQIDNIPLNNSNKLDHKALPIIEVKSEGEYIEPRNEVEKILSDIFKEILGISKVSVKDSFFELGGDSIKAIRIVSKMREAGYEVSVKEIMRRYTIESIARDVISLNDNCYSQDEVSGVVKQTPIIQLFSKWQLNKPEHFNQAVMIQIETDEEKVVRDVFDILTKHHDVLRSVYQNGHLCILPIKDSNLYNYEKYDLRKESNCYQIIEDLATEIQESINLSEGPLMKIAMFVTDTGKYLMIAIHHLIVDGVSWRILLEDIATLFKQALAGKSMVLPMKTASVIEWAEALEEYACTSSFNYDREYWNNVIKEIKQIKSNMVTVCDIENMTHYKAIDIMFSEEDTKHLLFDTHNAFNTEINDLLLCALSLAACTVWKKDKVIIGLEGHGREEIHKKIAIDRTIGWFTSMYPIVLSCDENIRRHIVSVKELIRKVPNHGIGYGLLEQYEMSADVFFNYLGQIDNEENALDSTEYSVGKSVADENRLPGDINFNGNINRNRLNFTLTYNDVLYSYEDMSNIADSFKKFLLEIIQYCMYMTESITTISDVDDEDLDLEDLDIINSFV